VLSGFPKSRISIVSPEGETRSTVHAVVSRDTAVIDDAKAIILAGDEIQRALPNGQIELFEVIDPAFYEGHHGFPPHYQVKIRRKGLRVPVAGNTIHVSGPNSRVNIGSHDESTNTAIIGNTFHNIKNSLAKNIDDHVEREKMLALVDAMESEKGKPGFAAAYQKFIAASAQYVTIIAPFLPLLASFFPS
jgi:hypothetical protein